MLDGTWFFIKMLYSVIRTVHDVCVKCKQIAYIQIYKIVKYHFLQYEQLLKYQFTSLTINSINFT